MSKEKQIELGNIEIRSVTYLGVVVNIVLAVVKVAVGIFAHSMALIADGIHSLSDMATDVVVLLGVYFGSKEPDSKHPYGHGRIETFAAAIVAVVLIVVGGFMIYRAALSIAKMHYGSDQAPFIGQAVLWVAIISVFSKELIYRITRKVAVKTNSSALYANAWHHRSDALSSVAVVIGFIATRFGYHHGDQVATIAVGLMIIFVGVKIIGECLEEFAERSADSQTIAQIEQIISSETMIKDWHKLRTRSVGREIFIDLHILVDPELNITDAHDITEVLERSMRQNIEFPINLTVHVEPYRPEMTKNNTSNL
ncbi:MAG: cation transporter [Sedimentisphaerales bacterium]|nr:cation transporter [Sedimentisphaerales bacterium]